MQINDSDRHSVGRSRLVKKLERLEAERPRGGSVAVPEVVRYNFADGP